MIDVNKLPNVCYKTGMKYEGNSPANVAWEEYIASGRKPLQWVADKFGKNNAWKVIKSKWNLDNKSLKFEILKGADESEFVDVSYEDICKGMKWKSFEILGTTSCVPVNLTLEEEKAMFAEAIKKTKAKDAANQPAEDAKAKKQPKKN